MKEVIHSQIKQKARCVLGYLGPEASFSHLCALELLQVLPAGSLKAFASISSIREALVKNELSLGLFPVENSLGGSVPESLDGLLLAPEDLQIRLEWVLPIEHYLVGFADDLTAVKEIRAHFQAFAQCEAYLKQNFANVTLQEWSSNSAAAQSLLDLDDCKRKEILAICSKEAAELYKIPVKAKKINDFSDNSTRFWLFGKDVLPLPENSLQRLTSIAFRIPQDVPGGLMKILATLANRNINLSKIESRPTKGRLCEYTFFIDFINPLDWVETGKSIIEEIAKESSYFRFLGSYSVFPLADLRFNNTPKS